MGGVSAQNIRGQLPPYGLRLSALPAAGQLFSGSHFNAGVSFCNFVSRPQGVFFSPSGAVEKAKIRPSLQALGDDYYTQHFGFMCKKELELEKTTHIPLRFRLGSLEQCNYLEGKR